MTVKDLKVGDPFPPNGKVYHVRSEGEYVFLTIERDDGSSYTTYLHKETPIADAYGGGSYKGDAHLS